MNSIMLGMVTIGIQNDSTPNEDVYTIQVDSRMGMDDLPTLKTKLADDIGNAERFIIQSGTQRQPQGSGWNVYTKQPDAAVELARYLNQAMGCRVSDQEIEDVRNRLIRVQKI
ncbi:hypothetical protein [Paenibacillus xerothermodurans]|uniref:Uncharacterized protein n=1 Tax=Paenibacillus xerothermodurans TaxID=1977292 RepID=A0A2W1NWW3_PAEXE|nr:hypothetical protein [Paenibacillus xerothermodurans]PZE19338.1 hypothetical protein CBW46_019205 [Paenibacillus xerothermodurans]